MMLKISCILIHLMDKNIKSSTNVSLQLKRIPKFILGSLKDFHCENYKLQQIVLAIKTFWVEVGSVRSTKDAWQMVHW